MRSFLIVFIILAYFQNVYAQDSTKAASPEDYFLELKIPKEWEITRMKQGSDFTLTAQSSDKELYLFYCQFMEDESRPKEYLDTYVAQLGMKEALSKEVKNTIKGKATKFYYAYGDGAFLNEKFKVFLLTTSINEKNIIAYIIYPVVPNPATQDLIEEIMLYK